jgi:hypothetical protein
VQSRKRREDDLGKADIVEAGDGDIARNVETHVAKLPQDAHRHEVIHAQNRRGPKPGSEQLLCRAPPAGVAV